MNKETIKEHSIDIALKRMRQLREKKGWSQDFIAIELGICQTTYGRIECGKHKIYVYQLIEIADILETSVSYLIGESEE